MIRYLERKITAAVERWLDVHRPEPYIKAIEILSPQPGDILILEHPGVLTDAAQENIKQSLHDLSGINGQVVILEEGMHLKLLKPT